MEHTKVCGRCKEELPVTEFYKQRRKGRSSGYQSYCKECSKANYKDRYQADKQKWRDRNVAGIAAARTFVHVYLSEHPCVDCGMADIRTLDFDHVRGVKTKNISKMVQEGFSIASIVAEIEKCDVRCANCHRIVTMERAGTTRHVFWLSQTETA